MLVKNTTHSGSLIHGLFPDLAPEFDCVRRFPPSQKQLNVHALRGNSSPKRNTVLTAGQQVQI